MASMTGTITRTDAETYLLRELDACGEEVANFDTDGILDRARDLAGSWDMDQIEPDAFWEIVLDFAM